MNSLTAQPEGWTKVRVPTSTARVLFLDYDENGEVAQPKRSGRDVIFQTLLPGVFVFLLCYYAFVISPSVADFYCDAVVELAKPMGLELIDNTPAGKTGILEKLFV